LALTTNCAIEGVDNPESVSEELVRICREDIEPNRFFLLLIVLLSITAARIVALDIEGKRASLSHARRPFYLRIGDEKREATPEELAELLDETRPLTFENLRCWERR